MKHNDEKFKVHFEEYMDFVTKNTRFPKSGDKFIDGTLMFGWNRWATSVRKDQSVIDFNQKMNDTVLAHNKSDRENKKNQMFYDKLTSPRTQGSPETLMEYLDGDNRFIYFSIDIYSQIMKYMGESPDILPYLKFIDVVWGGNMTWMGFHRMFNIVTLKDQLYDVLFNNNTNPFTDKQVEVLCYYYGIFDYDKKTLDELGSILNVTRERIRQIQSKVLRMFRHPSRGRLLKRYPTAESRNSVGIRNKIGHWFIIRIDGVNNIIKRPMFELEEALSDMGIDCSDPDADKVVKYSITYESLPSEMSYDVIVQMGIDAKGVFNDSVIYQYTEVRVDILPKRKTFEENLECTLEKLRRKAIRERVERELEENRHIAYEQAVARELANKRLRDKEKEECKTAFKNDISQNAQFIYSFTRRVYNITESVDFHNNLWISIFNGMLDGFMVPYDLRQKTADIIGEALSKKLKEFNITCVFTVYDDYGSIVQIKNNESTVQVMPDDKLFRDYIGTNGRSFYTSANDILKDIYTVNINNWWISLFNMRISNFLIKSSECKIVSEIMQKILEDRMSSFDMTCNFDEFDETYVTLRLTVTPDRMKGSEDGEYHFNIKKR